MNDAPVLHDRSFVLYWMIAARRTRWNYGLERAADWARHLQKPLLVFEPLRLDYPYASERLHRFVIQGMADNQAALAEQDVRYFPYVEPDRGAGKGLLQSLGQEACLVVTDDYPTFMLPSMIRAAAAQLDVRLEAIDGNGLLPLRAVERTYPTAYAFRRDLQRLLPDFLEQRPKANPLTGLDTGKARIPSAITSRWPAAGRGRLNGDLDGLSFANAVQPAPDAGGATEAGKRLARFLKDPWSRYAEQANHPEQQATSRLSPYLHFGFISPHEIFAAITRREEWTPNQLGKKAQGKRSGWWGMSEGAEAFLDQLVTWRELGYNYCAHRDDVQDFASLPPWAQETLTLHAEDPREYVYSRDAFESAATHDPLWNAAQNQLRREGHIHNYLRMLWGKKILEWSPTPEAALDTMIYLNDLYALDGRDPNSYSGITWVLGRYDRPWGPERPVYGKVRYMSSENTARKFPVRDYIETYTDSKQGTLFEESSP